MNITRGILLEEGKNSINVGGQNASYVAQELIRFMVDEFEKDYRMYKQLGGLCETPKIDTSLISCLIQQKERIEEFVETEDLQKVLGLKTNGKILF